MKTQEKYYKKYEGSLKKGLIVSEKDPAVKILQLLLGNHNNYNFLKISYQIKSTITIVINNCCKLEKCELIIINKTGRCCEVKLTPKGRVFTQKLNELLEMI